MTYLTLNSLSTLPKIEEEEEMHRTRILRSKMEEVLMENKHFWKQKAWKGVLGCPL